MDISVVIPCFNERESIKEVVERTKAVLDTLGRSYEVVVVDDGSADGSFEVVKQLKEAWLKIIRLRKNFGQTAAIAAGFNYAHGEIIVTLDSDLQNQPEDIPKLITKIDEGYELVNGWRKQRQEPFLSRRLPSIVANKIIRSVTGIPLHDVGCTLKAYRKAIIKNVKLYSDLHRFIPALLSPLGVKMCEVEVKHAPRKYGQSKYGFSRSLRVILDLITVKFLLAYLTHPMRIFGTLGLLLLLGSGFSGIVLVYQKVVHHIDMTNTPLLLLSVFLSIVGLQFISLGFLAEIIIRTYFESQAKVPYTIAEIIE
jgi:glycosyltransferase involved in cell wall biosynthesis